MRSIRISSNRSTGIRHGSKGRVRCSKPVSSSSSAGASGPGSSSRASWSIAAILVLALGVWMFFALRARSRWNGYVNALRSEPGVVVVSTGRAGGKYLLTGLRDPLAPDPALLLPSHNLGPDAVESRWELYQALHPSIVIARARQLLAPPAA